VGWPTFTVEHALFGLVLGLWLAFRSRGVPVHVSDTRTRVTRRAPSPS
jgi:hypothetical protein